MMRFARTTAAPTVKYAYLRGLSIVYAGVLVVCATAQLFEYETFADVIGGLGLGFDELTSVLLAALIVIGEVMALPFLLSVRVSALFRIVSAAASVSAACVWLYVGLAARPTDNVGLLGSTIPLGPGWWLVCVGVAMLAAASVGVWNMPPLLRRS